MQFEQPQPSVSLVVGAQCRHLRSGKDGHSDAGAISGEVLTCINIFLGSGNAPVSQHTLLV